MTTETTPDTISVSGSAKEEMDATHADVSVTIRGTSFFSGNAALTKAREVAALVAELKTVGVEEKHIELRGVTAEVSTGALGNKSSTAVYSLQIVKTPLPLLPEVIGAITSQKTAEMGGIVWQFGDLDAANLRLLEAALTRAQTKARLVARTLGVELIGVQSLTESFSGGDPVVQRFGMDTMSMGRARAARSQVDSDELGLEITHRKTVSAGVSVVFRVSAMVAEAR